MLPRKDKKARFPSPEQGDSIVRPIRQTWSREDGQGLIEYAVICSLVLVLAIGTVRLVGSNAKHAFSTVVSAFQPEQHHDD
jgi:Flp pilus assembly pilin Flp